jgi:hypothetical protein
MAKAQLADLSMLTNLLLLKAVSSAPEAAYAGSRRLYSADDGQKEGVMAQLRVRKKEEQVARPATALLPIALVLVAGIATTVLVDNGTKTPVAVAEDTVPWVTANWNAAQAAFARTQTYEVKGKAWVLADHSPITDFQPYEMVPMGEANGWTLVANKVRGVTTLSASAKAYDRLYVEFGHNRYGALRWRDVPR